MRIVTIVTAIAIVALATPTDAQRAVEVTPDARQLMINKALGSRVWSIVVDFEAQTVAGNVFDLDGGDPQFVFCEILERTITGPADFANFESVVLDCKGSDGCDALPCSPANWTEIGQTPVIASFFLPTGTPLHCNQVTPPQCAGSCDVVPGAQCLPAGPGCSCVVFPPTPTATATPGS